MLAVLHINSLLLSQLFLPFPVMAAFATLLKASSFPFQDHSDVLRRPTHWQSPSFLWLHHPPVYLPAFPYPEPPRSLFNHYPFYCMQSNAVCILNKFQVLVFLFQNERMQKLPYNSLSVFGYNCTNTQLQVIIYRNYLNSMRNSVSVAVFLSLMLFLAPFAQAETIQIINYIPHGGAKVHKSDRNYQQKSLDKINLLLDNLKTEINDSFGGHQTIHQKVDAEEKYDTQVDSSEEECSEGKKPYLRKENKLHRKERKEEKSSSSSRSSSSSSKEQPTQQKTQQTVQEIKPLNEQQVRETKEIKIESSQTTQQTVEHKSEESQKAEHVEKIPEKALDESISQKKAAGANIIKQQPVENKVIHTEVLHHEKQQLPHVAQESGVIFMSPSPQSSFEQPKMQEIEVKSVPVPEESFEPSSLPVIHTHVEAHSEPKISEFTAVETKTIEQKAESIHPEAALNSYVESGSPVRSEEIVDQPTAKESKLISAPNIEVQTTPSDDRNPEPAAENEISSSPAAEKEEAASVHADHNSDEPQANVSQNSSDQPTPSIMHEPVSEKKEENSQVKQIKTTEQPVQAAIVTEIPAEAVHQAETTQQPVQAAVLTETPQISSSVENAQPLLVDLVEETQPMTLLTQIPESSSPSHIESVPLPPTQAQPAAHVEAQAAESSPSEVAPEHTEVQVSSEPIPVVSHSETSSPVLSVEPAASINLQTEALTLPTEEQGQQTLSSHTETQTISHEADMSSVTKEETSPMLVQAESSQTSTEQTISTPTETAVSIQSHQSVESSSSHTAETQTSEIVQSGETTEAVVEPAMGSSSFMASICMPMCDYESAAPVCEHQMCRGCRSDIECIEELSIFEAHPNDFTITCHVPTGKCNKVENKQ